MDKRTPSVEWYIAESEADWERLQGPPWPDRAPVANRRRRLQRYCWSVAALLLLVSIGDWCWRTTQGRVHQAATAATATAQQALGTVAPGPAALVTNGMSNQSGMDSWDQYEQAQKSQVASSSLPSDWWSQYERASRDLRMAIQAADPAGHLEVAVQTVEIQSGLAVARFVSPSTRGAPAYRQTRFYRRTPTGGWVQMTSDVALWGPERSLETPSFVYHFRQHDAQAVTAVAPQIDALYTTLRRNFGLPIIPTPEKLVIDVSVTQPPGYASSGFGASNRFIVPSPALYWAPVELTDAELLAQSIALPLLAQVLAQASDHYQIGAAWQPLVSSLYLWQVWELDLPLAVWREDIVQWIYHDLPVRQPGQAVVLLPRYKELCAAHKLWLPSPAQMGIPLLCTERERREWFALFTGRVGALTRLDQLTVPASQHAVGALYRTNYHTGQTVALATLVEYAVAIYGRERLPTLVAGLGHYETWDTLLPAVYGVSATEFEAGWQAYLAAHYGVSVAHKSGSQ